MFDQLRPSAEEMKKFHDDAGFKKLQETGTYDNELPPQAMRSGDLQRFMDSIAPDTVRDLPVFPKNSSVLPAAAKNDNAVKSNEDAVTPIPGSGVITTVPAEGAPLKYDYLDDEDGIPPTIWSER